MKVWDKIRQTLILRMAFCGVLACVLGLASGVLTHRLDLRLKEKTFLNWARTLSNQADAFRELGSKAGQEEPVQWAVDQINSARSGKEYQVFAAKLRFPDGQSEGFGWIRKGFVFDFGRVFEAESGNGIRIEINAFPGVATWTVAVLGFLLSFLGLWGFSRIPPIEIRTEFKKDERIGALLVEAQELLSELGGTLRNLMKDTLTLVHIAESSFQKSSHAKEALAQIQADPKFMNLENISACVNELESALTDFEQFFQTKEGLQKNAAQTTENFAKYLDRIKTIKSA